MAHQYDPSRAKYIDVRVSGNELRVDYGNLVPLFDSLLDDAAAAQKDTSPSPERRQMIDLRPYGIDRQMDYHGVLALLEKLTMRPEEFFREEPRRPTFAEQLSYMLSQEQPRRRGPA